jgi:hypothetical protein
VNATALTSPSHRQREDKQRRLLLALLGCKIMIQVDQKVAAVNFMSLWGASQDCLRSADGLRLQRVGQVSGKAAFPRSSAVQAAASRERLRSLGDSAPMRRLVALIPVN